MVDSSDLIRRTKSELISLLESTQKLLAQDDSERAKMLHELQVHKIELELQNREIRQQYGSLEEAHDHLLNLYENAPVGFMLLDQSGVIQAANLTTERLLSATRSQLIGFPLSMFLDDASKRRLRRHLAEVFRSPEASNIIVVDTDPKGGGPHTLELTSTLSGEQMMVANGLPKESVNCNCVLVDRTGRRDAERGLRKEAAKRRKAESLYGESQYRSLHDPLTSLPNRLMLIEQGSQTLLRAARNSYRVAILFLDLDDFKPVNDLYGHSAGDELLREVAQRLKQLVRASDLVCRWGGDEFILIMEECGNNESIMRMAHNISSHLSAPFRVDSGQVNVGVTIGASLFPDDGSDISELIRMADIAMYHTKRTRRGGFEFFSEAMRDVQPVSLETTEVTSMRKMVERLEHARNDLFFQSVEAFSDLLGKSDPYISEHSRGVSDLAVEIAEEMGLSSSQITGLKISGLLHDIGKVAVPLDVWNKTEPLDAADWDQIRGHPEHAYHILKKIEFPWPVAEIVLQHHENLDGSGYPQGLKGDEILLEARIMAVADALDAMTSDRVYRPAMEWSEAFQEINRGRGKRYDPDVVDAANKALKQNSL